MQDKHAGHLSLLIVSDAGTSTVLLPERGEVVIGRGREADVRVDDAQLSRRHAAIVLGGPSPALRDLGSMNGTRLGKRRLEPNEQVPIALGDTVTFGSVVLTLQTRATGARPRRVWSHGYFEARIEEECARADRNGAPFAVMRVRVISALSTDELTSLLSDCLRPADIVAVYAPSELEVLLVDTTPDQVEMIRRRILNSFESRGIPLRIGAALYKRDGRTPEALIAHAGAFERDEEGGATSPATAPLRVGAMQRLQPLIERVASGVINVLIIGETGVGKEVMARTIHELSPRAKARLIAINCAALPEALLESELFGHERGAFTGAVQAKVGLLESAQGGTVFLDEAGEMPLALQAKLLRVLDQREVFRVGAVVARPIDVRFLAATNRDLAGQIARGHFRQDLYFRLNGITLAVPPLRERGEEIVPLALSFVADACRRAGRGRELRLTPPALALLQRYEWPGNVRELRNVIERAVLLCTGDEIGIEHLPEEKMVPVLRARPTTPPAASPSKGSIMCDDEPVTRSTSHPAPAASSSEASERERVISALGECAGNQTHAAKLLGVSRGTLIARLKVFGIPRPRRR